MRSHASCLALTAFSLQLASAAPATPLHGILDAVANATLVSKALTSSFDYIVVGGGTSGLVVAARLSENPANTVLVLEAGTLQATNPAINTPALAGSAEGTALDWNYKTVPQAGLNGTSVTWPRGKLLGGSSAFNIEVWNRAFKTDYDAWGPTGLGNTGWDWDSLLQYHEKSETFIPPTGNNLNVTPAYELGVHGKSGPIRASFGPYLSPQFNGLFDGLRSLDVPEMKDPNGGDNVGVGWITSSVDPKTRTRSYSTTGYLAPNVGRKNLLVITSALASKVNFASKKVNGNVVATGVSFVVGSVNYTATASAEVILSGGSINSPQLLELSGIGNPAILTPLGIKTLVNLPGVGENLQDHPSVAMSFQLKAGLESRDLMTNATFAAAANAAYANLTGILTEAAPILSYILPASFLSAADVEKGRALLAIPSVDLPAEQQKLVLSTYDTSPILELVPLNFNLGANAVAGAAYIGIDTALQHPLSRGNIHINSTSPADYPIIDPKYFSHPADSFFLSKGFEYVRKVAATPELSQFLEIESTPGLATVPANATDAEWAAFVSNHIGTEYHPIGTTSLLPRAAGGVVSPELIVYGTQNLRVIDAGIIPLHLATHIQTTAYAIGEKGAALILAK